MVRLTARVIRWGILLVVAWAGLVYGAPVLDENLPAFCARWNTRSGFCSVRAREVLRQVRDWARRYLEPLPRHARVRSALQQATVAFRRLEELLRRQVGDERVDAAVLGADRALQRLEESVSRDSSAGFRSKIEEVPENTREILRRVRESFDRLRQVLGSTGRRAEEVSAAAEDVKKALDALSDVLPER